MKQKNAAKIAWSKPNYHSLTTHTTMIIIFDRKGLSQLATLDVDTLRGADLSHLDLTNANLVQYDLRDVDLSNTNMRDADLRLADLSGAKLSGTNLSGANLTGAIVDNTALEQAVFNDESGVEKQNTQKVTLT